MGAIATLTTNMVPANDRFVESISHEEFCNADEGHAWVNRTCVNGITVLQYDRAVLFCSEGGKCAMVRQEGTDMKPILDGTRLPGNTEVHRLMSAMG